MGGDGSAYAPQQQQTGPSEFVHGIRQLWATSASGFPAAGSALTYYLGRRLVGPQATPGRVPQPAVARPLRERDLADQPGCDPVRITGVGARHVGEGRAL